MEFLKAGEPVESNIFNQLDEKKRALIEKGVDVINLSIGTPDFQPDRHVMEAVSRAALDPDMYKYSLTETPELLEAVEKWYKRRYDVDLADDEIIQVSGSQEGFAHIGFAFAGPNDLILAPDPGYPIFTFGPLMTGATIALYPLREENNWQLDFNDIPEDIAERAKAIVVSYPNNPTTAVADRAFYEKLVLFAREHNMIVLHDNAYSDLMLDGTDGLSFLSIPGAKEVGVEFNSLSKTYSITGWRLGYLIGPAEVIEGARKVHDFLTVGAAAPLQEAAVAGLEMPASYYEELQALYTEKRDHFLAGLDRVGLKHNVPQGTYFVMIDISDFLALPQFKGWTDLQFCEWMIREVGVAAVPGSSFFREPVNHLIRMHFARGTDVLDEAVRRLEKLQALLK